MQSTLESHGNKPKTEVVPGILKAVTRFSHTVPNCDGGVSKALACMARNSSRRSREEVAVLIQDERAKGRNQKRSEFDRPGTGRSSPGAHAKRHPMTPQLALRVE